MTPCPSRYEELFMPREKSLAMAVLVLFLTAAPTEAGPDLRANAALKYWQAFTTLPRFTADEQNKLKAECATLPLDARAREMVTQARYSLEMMHRGAAAPRCDWAIGWADEGLENQLPYLDGAKLLSSLSCLRARIRFEDGQSGEAIKDVLAAMTLGRHASLDGSLPSILSSYEIERGLSETLALYLPRLDAALIKALREGLTTLPAGGSLANGIREEQILETGWFVRKVKEANDKESVLVFLSRLWNSRELGSALLDDCGGTAIGVIKYTEELRSWYPELAKQMELSLDRFEKEQERAAIQLGKNPMYQRFVPGIIKCRWQQSRAEVRRAMLLAALAVQIDGRSVLKSHPDPMVGGQFAYVPFEGGFELRSNWLPDEKACSKWNLGRAEPVMLVVGRREK
jgi:hypothetical protein